MSTSLFSNRLLLVSLFQGFSRLDFLDIVEKVPLDFQTYKQRETIVRQDEDGKSLCILLGGEVEVEVESPEHTYRLVERIRAPWVIQLESLFGLHNRYTRSVRACEEAQVVRISKQSVRQLLMRYPAFQINYYNALSTYAQRLSSLQWQQRYERLDERFLFFMQRRVLRPTGSKRLYVLMEVLAHELGATRLRVSQMLSELAKRQVLTYSRGVIIIPSFEAFVMVVQVKK